MVVLYTIPAHNKNCHESQFMTYYQEKKKRKERKEGGTISSTQILKQEHVGKKKEKEKTTMINTFKMEEKYMEYKNEYRISSINWNLHKNFKWILQN